MASHGMWHSMVNAGAADADKRTANDNDDDDEYYARGLRCVAGAVSCGCVFFMCCPNLLREIIQIKCLAEYLCTQVTGTVQIEIAQQQISAEIHRKSLLVSYLIDDACMRFACKQPPFRYPPFEWSSGRYARYVC